MVRFPTLYIPYLATLLAVLAVLLIGCKRAASSARIGREEVVIISQTDAMRMQLGKDVTLECRRIEPGEFVMGAGPDQGARGMSDQRFVRITEPFYIGIYEVTQEQYEIVMGHNRAGWKGADRPVYDVSWYEAVEFCERLSALTGKRVRLPTEAEWEFACRAGTSTRYSYGDDPTMLGEYAWHSGNSQDDGTLRPPHPVGQKKPNGWGLHDMHGNVREWCSDWAGSPYSYKDVPVNPKGPPTGRYRVIRGGDCWSGCDACDSFWSTCAVPRDRTAGAGFRIVVEAETLPKDPQK